jgi:hypothetical protein
MALVLAQSAALVMPAKLSPPGFACAAQGPHVARAFAAASMPRTQIAPSDDATHAAGSHA